MPVPHKADEALPSRFFQWRVTDASCDSWMSGSEERRKLMGQSEFGMPDARPIEARLEYTVVSIATEWNCVNFAFAGAIVAAAAASASDSTQRDTHYGWPMQAPFALLHIAHTLALLLCSLHLWVRAVSRRPDAEAAFRQICCRQRRLCRLTLATNAERSRFWSSAATTLHHLPTTVIGRALPHTMTGMPALSKGSTPHNLD